MYKLCLHLSLALFPVLLFGAADAYRVMWRSNPATSMVVGWNQLSGANPKVWYDTVDHGQRLTAYQHHQAPDRVITYRGMTNHFVRLENLTPDTPYYFVISDSEGAGRRLWFRTAPDRPQPFTFIAGGDSRSGHKPRRAGNKLVAKLRPLFILFGGDYTLSGRASQWKKWFADWQLTISSDGRIYPIVPTHGNHENADLKMMHNLFDTPHPDQYYALPLAGGLMRVWILNSELEALAKEKEPAQQAWFESDLSQNESAIWKVATYHRPMRPHTARKSEGTRRIDAWAHLFHDHGVDLVIESDTHMVKRTYPIRPSTERGSYESFVRDDNTGTIFVGEGSWGAPTRRANDDKPWTMASDSFHQFKRIHVSQDELLLNTVTFENSENVEPLTEATRLQDPKGIVFWKPETGQTLRLPFDPTHPSYQPPARLKVIVGRGETWNWSLDGDSWTAAVAPLGYGDRQVRSTIAKPPAKPRAAYFRKTFIITDPTAVSRLFLDLLVDDGCIITINGKEVVRHNMPRGEITSETFALKRAASWRKKRTIPIPIDPMVLTEGENHIEARVFQYSPESSDIVFDLAVRVKQTTP